MYIENEEEYQRAIDLLESLYLKPKHLRDDKTLQVLKEAIVVYEDMYLEDEDADQADGCLL